MSDITISVTTTTAIAPMLGAPNGATCEPTQSANNGLPVQTLTLTSATAIASPTRLSRTPNPERSVLRPCPTTPPIPTGTIHLRRSDRAPDITTPMRQPSPTGDTREKAAVWIRQLAAIERPSASPGERRAAEWIVRELAIAGVGARIESERAHGTHLPFALPSAVALIAGSVRSPRLAAPG